MNDLLHTSSDRDDEPRTPDLRDAGQRLAGGIGAAAGMALHLAVGTFYAAAGLVAPGWAVAVLWAVWLALAAVLWRHRRRPVVALSVPFVAAAVWWAVVTAGDAFLGWTA